MEKNKRRGEKFRTAAMMAGYAFLLGAAAGGIVWVVLWFLQGSMNLIWTAGYEKAGGSAWYTCAVCIGGGVLIGLLQRKYGILPDTMEEVFGKLKRDGTYRPQRLYILVIAFLLPLVFGGAIGPEAGLTGLVTMLCCMAGNALTNKTDEVRELAKAGMAATLGVIFNAPFFGFVNNIEHTREEEKRFFTPKELKISKVAVYAAGICGAFAVMHSLRSLFGGGSGFPRVAMEGTIRGTDWMWFPVFAGCGILLGVYFTAVSAAVGAAAGRIRERRLLSCIIAGVCLAVLGSLFPACLFSGEEQMGILQDVWQTIPVLQLLILPLVKLLATNICVSFGWKGGSIFPIIFSAVSLGYGLAALTGALPVFAVAVTTAAAYGYIMRKPLTVVAILFLCFPIRLVIPLAAAAYLASFVPPLQRRKAVQD